MNINNQRTVAFLGALTLIVSVSCGGDDVDSTVVATDDAYLYTSYYPADLAYSGYYWADSWDYGLYYYSVTGGVAQATAGAGTSTGTGGSTGTTTSITSPGAAIRALARGEAICQGQVTVTAKTAAPACAGPSTTPVRNGVTIVFNRCQLAGGGTINGTFDVQATRTASEQTCSATTSISLGYTTTITNLSYTNPGGAKVVIPSQTNTGTTNYTFGQTPTTFTISSNGELQLFNSAGTMLSDLMHAGDRTYTIASGGQAYSFDGTVSVQDQHAAGAATLTATGITRTTSCCRPTAGTLIVNYTSGVLSGQRHTWTFGPSCSAATRDGNSVTLPACI